MKLDKLLQPWVTTLLPDRTILGLHNDSRQIKPGYLFFAYPGALVDGRLFIEKAVVAGAIAVVFEPEKLPEVCFLPQSVPCIPIPDLNKKLAAIASRFYEAPSHTLLLTGVTGTNGKTTIAYQLAQAYGLLGQKSAYIGTLGHGNVDALEPVMNTTPDALCLQKFLHDYKKNGVQQVCMEVSSHALSQGRVDNIDFTAAIYTNLSHEHLDYHLTMDAYAAAKAALFMRPSLKWAIINHDDAYSSLMLEKLRAACQPLTYGLQAGADVQALNCQISMEGSDMLVVSPWGSHQVHINLLGAFNIYNSLAIFTRLLADGIDPADVVDVMTKLSASPGRMEVVAQKPCVIVDYAHTPDALENVLTTLQQLKKGRLGVVFGCGGDRDKTKRPMMGRIASQYADFVIVTSDNPRTEVPSQIIADITAGFLPTVKALTLIDRAEAIKYALSMLGEHDILLIAGKGHEAYQQIGTERFAFSDQDVVRQLLEK